MTTQNHGQSRRSTWGIVGVSSSSTSSKRSATLENSSKPLQAPQSHHQSKKRVALTNLTNNVFSRPTTTTTTRSASSKSQAPAPATTTSIKAGAAKKKGPSACTTTRNTALPRSNPVPPTSAVKSSSSSRPIQGNDKVESSSSSAFLMGTCNMDISPASSVSLDESMSTCDSLKSPDIEYLDNADSSQVTFIERKASTNLRISDPPPSSANATTCKRDILMGMTETNEKIVDVDNNFEDPQLCATLACDIYNHLRASENKKRPRTDFMERVQKDINASMRAILIDWLVEVAEEYRLVPDTLYLTVNYIDRYLSGNVMNRQRLQLLGVACMMIAAKYEEICAPQVEEFCYITDNTYFKDEVLQMESAVLNFLKFEMTAPTVKCFLRRFANAAHGSNEVPSLQLECLANYVAELSLLEYNMLCYPPSLIASSAIFLAKFILQPGKRPWNATLGHYTLYKPSELRECVKELHRLFFNSNNTSLPAIREKYNQHKYKFVAKKYCPPSIPSELFHDLSM